MGDGRTYIGVGLFALFLIIDAILYSFESALKNINEKEIDEKRFRKPYMVSIISLLIATLAMLISAASLCLQLFGNTPTP